MYFFLFILIVFCFIQILFLGGLYMIIGLERTVRFFFQSYKLKGTAFFFGGVLLVLIGRSFIGMITEFYGFFLLFRFIFPDCSNEIYFFKFNFCRGFIPITINFLRRLPIIGSILLLPGFRQVNIYFLLYSIRNTDFNFI